MTNKERIIELSKSQTPKEIAETCNVSISYVYRVLRELNPKRLTPQNYFDGIQKGITKKEELAELFKVSRRTILRFEKKLITKEAIALALYISGENIEAIKQKLCLTNHETAQLAKSPTLPHVIKELQKMLKILNAHKNKTSLNAELYQKIFEALKILNC